MGVVDRNRLLARTAAATALPPNVSVRTPGMTGPYNLKAPEQAPPNPPPSRRGLSPNPPKEWELKVS